MRGAAYTLCGVTVLFAAGVMVGAGFAAESIAPFPAGKNAALVKEVCTSCHSAMLVVDRRYDVAAAKKRYRLFVGDPESEQGKLIVEYLTTVLGEE